MSDNATKKDVQRIVDKAVVDFSEVVSGLAQNIHHELAEIKLDITDLKESHNRLINTLDNFLKRLDGIEVDNAAHDAQLARL